MPIIIACTNIGCTCVCCMCSRVVCDRGPHQVDCHVEGGHGLNGIRGGGQLEGEDLEVDWTRSLGVVWTPATHRHAKGVAHHK
jgi:hypothetical protein